MLIDWFTVLAQAVNFLILVWLLKRFLYQPILKAVDAREKRIAAELASAADKEADAMREREEFRSKNAEFEQQRKTLLEQAKAEAAAEHRRLTEVAREEVAALRERQYGMLHSEFQNLRTEVSRRTMNEVFAIARQTLGDLADDTLQARMVDVFMRRLHELGASEKQTLSASLQASPDPVLVRSAFELPQAQREQVEAAIRATFGAGASARFEVESGLISGIELLMQGHKIAWSLDSYLAEMEQGLNALLKTQQPAQKGAEQK
ncbi:MAG: F0F1 ATP synthase subunit B [Sideroxydans sp.]|nr:F0F1 ATP synthase subunit B [Sideroxydans sp.]